MSHTNNIFLFISIRLPAETAKEPLRLILIEFLMCFLAKLSVLLVSIIQ